MTVRQGRPTRGLLSVTLSPQTGKASWDQPAHLPLTAVFLAPGTELGKKQGLKKYFHERIGDVRNIFPRQWTFLRLLQLQGTMLRGLPTIYFSQVPMVRHI